MMKVSSLSPNSDVLLFYRVVPLLTQGDNYKRQAAIKQSLPYKLIGLKTVDTISRRQRLAFTVSVSQHMHKITNLWKFELNW